MTERQGGAWTIATFRGTKLRIHWTFLILLAFVTINGFVAGGTSAAAGGLLFVLMLFASVVAHEYGHAAMARRFGIRTPDILLLPIGGMARLDRMPEEPNRELAVALAGPAVTLAIIVTLALVLGGVPVPMEETAPIGLRGWATQLLWANVVLLIFNLLPAFPMDGGRVLRALLSTRLGAARATRIAARVGQGAALLFGVVALIGGQPILLLVAIFVFFAAGAEERAGAMRRIGSGVPISRQMVSRFDVLAHDATLGDAARLFGATSQDEIPLVDAEGRPTGFLTLPSVLLAIRQRGEQESAQSAAIQPVAQLPPGTDAAKVAAIVVQRQGPVAIVDGAGRLVGYQTLTNLAEELAIDEARAAVSPR